jgi:peroxiredoxin
VQKEVVDRLGLSYEILSDRDFALAGALSLPTFDFRGVRLHTRLVLAAEAGRIVKVFYPVFPPDRSASEVLAWLER